MIKEYKLGLWRIHLKWTDFKGKEKEIDQIIESVQQEFDTSVFSTKVAGKGMLLCSLLQFIFTKTNGRMK